MKLTHAKYFSFLPMVDETIQIEWEVYVWIKASKQFENYRDDRSFEIDLFPHRLQVQD